MKKYGHKPAALLIAAALLASLLLALSLSGCGRDSKPAEIETVRGVWKSNDGYTLTLTEDTLSLEDSGGENCLPYDCLNYWVDVKKKDGDRGKDRLYVSIEGQEYGVFDVYLKEDTMTLTYVAETLGIPDSDVTTINLTRVD